MSTHRYEKNKPPYLLGLLCLLPLIGALVGIALIFYGIFRYKDKFLIAIGSFGIIFTICIYFFLFQNLKYGSEATKSFAKISQKELNNLVKHVEFYKLQNNKYPDSLEQLEPDGTFLIQDPLLIRKMDKTIKTDFQYKRIGDKYTLFSVGIDGIPNTADDIYPDIFNADTTKFGLIKR
jgi:hypothetical protein